MKNVKVLCAVVFSFAFIVASTPVVEVQAATGTTTVYVTKTGEKYHTSGCSYLRKSKIEKDLSTAVDEGYEPCSRCNPPTLK